MQAAATEDVGIAVEQEGDEFVHRFSADPQLFRFIVGQGGATKLRIEGATGAAITVPNKTDKDAAAVAVKGSLQSVAAARAQLAQVVSSALATRALDYNYFLSLPLATPQTHAAMEAFKAAVLAHPQAAADGIDASIFTPAAHLHLTVCMLKLFSQGARASAALALERLQPAAQAILANGPLRVAIRNLRVLRGNGDSSQVHVLYADVEDAEAGSGAVDRVRELCDAATAAFAAAGLVLPTDQRPVTLHATLVNTRYRQRGRGAGKAAMRQAIDARAIMQRFGELDLGRVEVRELHLSMRGAYGPNGYYRCVGAVQLEGGL